MQYHCTWHLWWRSDAKARRHWQKEHGPSVRCWNQSSFHLAASSGKVWSLETSILWRFVTHGIKTPYDPSYDPSYDPLCRMPYTFPDFDEDKLPHAANRGGAISIGCCTPWPYTTIWASWLSKSHVPCRWMLWTPLKMTALSSPIFIHPNPHFSWKCRPWIGI